MESKALITDEIQTHNNPSPVEITDEIKNCLYYLGEALENHAQTGIRVGKELLRLKEVTPHGKYGELAEWKFGLKEDTRLNFMNVARIYGQNPTREGFSSSVLTHLSRPSTPESASQAAEKEERLTVKQAKELIAAQKRIDELEAGRTPDLKNLIPDLMRKYKGASITIGAANRLSVLNKDQQELFLTFIESSLFANKEKQTALDDKLRALEDLNKISKERDEVKKQLEEIAESDTAKILLDKENKIKQLRKEYDNRLIQERDSIGKQASEFHEGLNKDKIEKAEKDLEKAQRERKDAVAGRSAANEDMEAMERKIRDLESQLEVDSPTNVDNARVRHIEDAGRGLLVSLNELRKDLDGLGGGMENSLTTAANIIKKATLELSKLQGLQDAIINV
ncbi:MAG: hypothetical protein DRH26_00670 [Deltaproteobacteria bacterium]|nr:MAG: hypothetical protein DRH26_00670 [Deltaproteobacteria bacterium]